MLYSPYEVHDADENTIRIISVRKALA